MCSKYYLEGRHVELAEVLLKNKARVIHDNCSALERACHSKKCQRVILETLIWLKLYLKYCSIEDVKFMMGNGDLFPLMRASCGGAKELLAHGADIDAVSKDTSGRSVKFALLLAIENGHVSTVKLLLEKGAQVEQLWYLSQHTRSSAQTLNSFLLRKSELGDAGSSTASVSIRSTL